jgi:hypothetical protein
MPYSKCPICGVSFHLLVTSDLGKWYAEHAPGIKVGEVVNLLCLECWRKSEKADPGASPNGSPGVPVGNS